MNAKLNKFLDSFLDDYSSCADINSITEQTNQLFKEFLEERTLLELKKDKKRREVNYDDNFIYKDDQRGQLVKHKESGKVGAVVSYDPIVFRKKGDVDLPKGKRFGGEPRPAVDYYGDDNLGDVRVVPVVDGEVPDNARPKFWYAGEYDVLPGETVDVEHYIERTRNPALPTRTGEIAKRRKGNVKVDKSLARWTRDEKTGQMVLANPEDFDEETRKELMKRKMPSEVDGEKWERELQQARRRQDSEDEDEFGRHVANWEKNIQYKQQKDAGEEGLYGRYGRRSKG